MKINGKNQDKPIECNVNSASAPAPKKIPKKITQTYLHNAGLAYLQRFPTSITHFERVMMRKIKRSCNYHKEQDLGECQKLLSQSVENFTRIGLLNDSLYLQGMITSLRRRGLSKQAITAKLQSKGFPSSTAVQSIRDFDESLECPHDRELVAALICARKKRLGPFCKKDIADRQKELATLGRAGFGYDIAQTALKMELDEAQQIIHSAAA